jgi:hypothetical protein
MTQIKLSIAFVLAAAAIAPVVAQPIREPTHEFAGNVGPHRLPHHRHNHHNHHRHHRVPIHEQSSPEPTSDITPPSRREYFDELEVRGLLFGQNGNLNILNSIEKEKNLDAQLEHKHQALESENRHLEHKNRRLEHKERHLEHKDHRLEREDRKLEHKKHSLKKQDKSLLNKKHRLEQEDKTLEDKHHSLLHKNKELGKKDKKLAHKGKVLAHKNKKLEHKGEVLAHHDKVLAQDGKTHGHRHSEPEIDAREYADFEEVFERARDSAGFRSVNRLPRFGNGLRPFRSPGLRPGFPFGGGHGPVVFPGRRPFLNGPGRLPHRPLTVPHKSRMIVDREYTGSDDMVERDFEEDEFEARELEDELYLD